MRGAATAALVLDLIAGEPPASIHPTIGMGRWISRGRAARRSTEPLPSFLEGTAVVAGGALLTASLAFLADRALDLLPPALGLVSRAAALKPALSVRALVDAAAEVEHALVGGELERARELLSWHLVSRDTSSLSAAGVAAAAIESVAENLNDGFVAPLMAFRAGGLTAAYLFRFINTADAMLGYHTPELEWFGKSAARLDDALAYLPARCAALLIAAAAVITGDSARGSLALMISDAGITASPNAGWPMAAMAGALGVRLEKRGHYVLNASAREPTAHDIQRARRLVLVASVIAALAADLI
jgi:adenosylcobinamide-phosphate synthase